MKALTTPRLRLARTLGLALAAALLSVPSAQAQWSISSNPPDTPSFDSDAANGIATDAEYLYAVGHNRIGTSFHYGVDMWIEKRFLSTGALVWSKDYDAAGTEVARSAEVFGNYLLVVGDNAGESSEGGLVADTSWIIRRLNKVNGVAINTTTFNPSGADTNNIFSDAAFGSAVDGSHLYVIGRIGGVNGLVQQRSATNPATVLWSYNLSATLNWGKDVAVGGAFVYALAYYGPGLDPQWEITKLHAATGLPVAGFGTGGKVYLNPSGVTDGSFSDMPYAITLGYDNAGVVTSIYATGMSGNTGRQWVTYGLDATTGAQLWPPNYGPPGDARAVKVCGNNTPVLAGFELFPGSRLRLERLDPTTGLTVQTATSAVAPSEGHALAIRDAGAYVAGQDKELGASDPRWRLERYDIGCPVITVGVNKDLLNDTGQPANDIEILLQGVHPSVLFHYDGYPSHLFADFAITSAAGGNTRLHWTNPNGDIPDGDLAHVGFQVPGTSVNILGVFWSRDGGTTGCANQVNANTHYWGTPGGTVTYKNGVLGCQSGTVYVGDISVEWHSAAVDLADLNATSVRTPISVDTLPDAPILLNPRSKVSVSVPTAPVGAEFGVLIFKVSSSPTLTGPDVTTDFMQFPVVQPPATVSPPDPNRCLADKNQCVSRHLQAALACHATAEKIGAPVSDACLDKAATKYTGGTNPEKGCFARAEARSGDLCLTKDDATERYGKTLDFAEDAAIAVDPFYPGPSTNPCSAAKLRCVQKAAKGVLGCYQKAIKAGAALDPACTAKAGDKLTSCLAKLDASYPLGFCTSVGEPVDAQLDTFVERTLCALGYSIVEGGCAP